MNPIYFILFLLAICLLYLYSTRETFWGGYIRVPYMGQEVPVFGRTGVDAATDNPRFFTNCDDFPINQ